MAEVAVSTFVSTEEYVADERVIEMDNTMRKLDPDTTQFTTMLNRLPSEVSTREKFNWLEESYVNDNYSMTAYTAGAATITLTNPTPDGAAIMVNDMLRNMRTGQACLVTGVVPATGVLTITWFGSNAAGNAGDRFLFVGSAHKQGGPLPAPKYSQRVLGFNYTQIFRSSWSFSRTATAIELYGGREPAKEGARKAVEHKRELEHSAFFGGPRNLITSGQDPQGISGGLIEFIQTNKQNVGGELTSDFLDLWLAGVLAKGSSDKVIFTGTVGAYYVSRFNRAGQGAFWKPADTSVHGVKVDGFISGVFGYQIPIVVKKEWANYPSGANGYNGLLFCIDMSNVSARPLRDGDTKMLTDRQPAGEDRMANEYMTEKGWEVAQEKTHGLLTGIA